MTRFLLALGGFLVIAATHVFAAPTAIKHPDLFGVTLGDQFDFPRCPPLIGGSDPLQGYKNGFCLDSDMPAADGLEHEVELKFSNDTLPDFREAAITGGMLTVGVIDGRVDYLNFWTDGLDSQQEVFALLQKKFGKPFMSSVSPMQNAFGATFKVIDARWVYGVDIVLFSGAFSLDGGSIKVMTQEAFARRFPKKEPHL